MPDEKADFTADTDFVTDKEKEVLDVAADFKIDHIEIRVTPTSVDEKALTDYIENKLAEILKVLVD